MTSLSSRRPRFKRAKTRPFRLTERDVEIIMYVYRHRLLDTPAILALLGSGSAQQIKRRLQLLYHGRYLDRPRAQLNEVFRHPGSVPMVYALGNRGADVVASELGLPRRQIDWTAKNRSVRSTFFRHTLLVSSIMVAFEVSCRKRGAVRLIDFDELLESKAPEATRAHKRSGTWFVYLPNLGRRSITPDNIFGLHFLDRPEGANKTFFFLEADRGTMPVVRRSATESSIYRKLVLYHKTFRDEVHTKRFGIKSFRVLTVTESPKRARVNSMIKAAQRLDGLQELFLFTSTESLIGGDALSATWTNGRGERVVLG